MTHHYILVSISPPVRFNISKRNVDTVTRSFVCNAFRNDCIVIEGADKKAQLIELGEVWPCMKHTAVVDHSFWKGFPASSQVCKVLADYKALSEQVCDMSKFAFCQHPKFQAKAKAQMEVNATELKIWVDKLPKSLAAWVDEGLAQSVHADLLSVCEQKQKVLFSAGLTAVFELVQKCLCGPVPACDDRLQQEMLMKIPRTHVLKHLIQAFLKAG